MQNTLIIGQIVKPQGVRGEVKVIPITDDSTRFKKLRGVYIDGEFYRVLGAKITTDAVILSINGINDRDTAELFRGKFLRVERSDAAQLKEDSYFIEDIKECSLFVEGKPFGKIIDVTSAKTDVFTVQTIDGKIMRFPFLKDVIISVSVEEKVVDVFEKRLKEIAVYED